MEVERLTIVGRGTSVLKGDEEHIKLHVSSLLYLQVKPLSPHFHPYRLFPSPDRAPCRLARWALFLSIYLLGV